MEEEIIEKKDNDKKKPKEVRLLSEMYNHDNEKIIKREKNEEPNDALTWGFVLGFLLFFILTIFIIIFTR